LRTTFRNRSKTVGHPIWFCNKIWQLELG
jgi:hypothetical protein